MLASVCFSQSKWPVELIRVIEGGGEGEGREGRRPLEVGGRKL
jgi:hypothetical protein